MKIRSPSQPSGKDEDTAVAARNKQVLILLLLLSFPSSIKGNYFYIHVTTISTATATSDPTTYMISHTKPIRTTL